MAGTIRIDSDRWSRPVAFIAAIVVHVPLLFLAQPRLKQSGADPIVTVSLEFDKQQERARERPPSPQASSSTTGSTNERAPIESTDPTADVDWTTSGAIAAQAAVGASIQAERYRSLGPQRRQPTAPDVETSVFQTTKHRFGDAEIDPMNYDIVWLNDRCFIELGKPVTPRADARIPGVNIPKCMWSIGEKPARGDLFDHLKDDPRTAPEE